MVKKPSLTTRWLEYRFSKTAYFWSCIACIVGTMGVGFTWGGWMTAGAANRLADSSSRAALAQLAASYCVARFEHSSDAAAQLAALEKTAPYDQDDFIASGGWVTPPGWSAPVIDAADVCAQRLLSAKLSAPKAAATTVEKPAAKPG